MRRVKYGRVFLLSFVIFMSYCRMDADRQRVSVWRLHSEPQGQ